MTAKIEMKSRNTDVATAAAAVMARTMAGAVPAAMTVTRSVWPIAAKAGVVASAVTVAMSRAVMTGAATVAGAMTGTAGVVVVTRLHGGRSEDCETGRDSQDSDEIFHIELGLIRCRQMSGL